MRAFLNELALADACRRSELKHKPLSELLLLRATYPEIRESMYCSKELLAFKVDQETHINCLMTQLPRDKRESFLRWVTTKGPFFDDDRLADAEADLYIHNGLEVTRIGLGEAAARLTIKDSACVFSPTIEHTIELQTKFLEVQKECNIGPQSVIQVLNHWIAESFAEYIKHSEPEPESWNELIDQCKNRFHSLIIGDNCHDSLKKTPFCRIISKAILKRLDILDKIAGSRSDTGEFLSDASELHKLHFQGENPLFSDESEVNKSRFKSEMTFPEPSGTAKVTYFWHGKIRRRQQRIHFEWPIPQDASKLKIGYIGPKISKH